MNKTSFLKLLVFILFFAITTLSVYAENGISQDKENDSGYSEIEKATKDVKSFLKFNGKDKDYFVLKLGILGGNTFSSSNIRYYKGEEIGTIGEIFGPIFTFEFVVDISYLNFGIKISYLYQESKQSAIIPEYKIYDRGIDLYLYYKIKLLKSLFLTANLGIRLIGWDSFFTPVGIITLEMKYSFPNYHNKLDWIISFCFEYKISNNIGLVLVYGYKNFVSQQLTLLGLTYEYLRKEKK